MAEGKKSKTNVHARSEAKNKVQVCRRCGNAINVVLTCSLTGKKRMIRKCCGELV
jgi:hypothetical protein